MAQRTYWILLAGLVACGGRVLEQPNTDSAGSGATSQPAAGATGSAGQASGSKDLPKHPLSKCVPGFDRAREPQRACNWTDADGTCFEEMDAACACICPLDKDSTCWSSFPEPNQGVPVYCE